jgi:hypothetical protein
VGNVLPTRRPTPCGSSFMRSPTTSAISCARWRRRSRSELGANHRQASLGMHPRGA